MTLRVQSLRSSTKGARPTGRAVGEIYTNFPDQQIGVVGPSGNIDLLAVRNFSATTDYVVGDLVARGGDIYRAAVAVTAGAWNAAQWSDIVHEADRHHGVTLFDPSKGYLQNELVAQSGEIYRANAVVSAHAFNAAEWTKISPTPAAVQGVSPFSATATYATDDLVSYQGKIYRSIGAIAAAGPWNSTQWEDININPTAGVVPFSATATYAVNDLVAYQGKIYRNTVAGTGAWNAANWADTDTTLQDAIRAFDATKTYVANDLVWNAGKIYSAKAAVPAGAFNAAQWNEIGAQAAFPLAAFDATKAYNAGDIVISGGKLYAAKAGVAAGAFNAAQWNDLNGDAYLDATQVWTKGQSGAPVAGTGAFDFAAANNFTINGAGAAVTIANPTNVVAGQSGAIVINNAASVAFGTFFKFDSAKTPTASGAGKKDVLVYYVMDATNIVANLVKGVQ